jgi:hypothetical protein
MTSHSQKIIITTATADEYSKIGHDTANVNAENIIFFVTDCNVQALDIISFSFKLTSLLKYRYVGL